MTRCYVTRDPVDFLIVCICAIELRRITKGQGTGKICSLYWRGFVLSRLFFIHFTITGVKKIIRYTEVQYLRTCWSLQLFLHVVCLVILSGVCEGFFKVKLNLIVFFFHNRTLKIISESMEHLLNWCGQQQWPYLQLVECLVQLLVKS